MATDLLGGFDADHVDDVARDQRNSRFAASGSFDALALARRKKHHSETVVQLSAMMYKHLLIFCRNGKNIAREIIVPFVYMSLLLLLYALVKTAGGTSAEQIAPAFFNVTALRGWINAAGDFQNQSCLVIGFSGCGGLPDTLCSDTVFDEFASIFKWHLNESLEVYYSGQSGVFCNATDLATPGLKSCLPPLEVRIFASDAELTATAMSQGNIVYGAAFTLLPSNITDLSSEDVQYTLRTNHSILSDISDWLSNSNATDQAQQLTIQNIEKSAVWASSGIMSFQSSVDRAIIATYAQLNNIDMNGMANQSHVHVLGGGVDPNQKADLTVVDTLQAMVPIYVTLVFALQVKTMLQHLLHEKESRIQIGLETMGLYPWVYHSSWILTGLLWAIPTIAIVLIASALGIFRHSSFWVLLLFFLLCSCACIAFAFFFAATFNDAHLGALIGFFIFFLSSVPGFALIQRGNLALTMAVSIFLPPVAFNLGCNILVSAENAVYYSGNETFGVGVTFDTWNAETNFGITFVELLGIIILDTTLYGLAATFGNVFIGCRNGRVRGRCKHLLDCDRRRRFVSKNVPRAEAMREAQRRTRERVESLTRGAALVSVHSPTSESASQSAFNNRRSRLLSSVLHSENCPSKHPHSAPPQETGLRKEADEAEGYDANTLSCVGVSKKFAGSSGSREFAIANINMEFHERTITVLLGQNGAGKTTTVRLLAGLLLPTEGEIRFGPQLVSSAEGSRWSAVRKRQGAQVGVCPEHDVFFDKLSVREHLYLFATFKGLSKKQCTHEVDRVIKQFGLDLKRNTMTRSLSQGNKRLLSVATALVGRPTVVLLDEPSSGMDIWSRRVVWSALEDAKANGQIVIMTTLFTNEAEVLADSIAILHEGQLAAKGSAGHLKKLFAIGYSLTLYPNISAVSAFEEEYNRSGFADQPRFEMVGEALVRTTFNLETPASECSPKRAFVNTRAMHNESSASLLSSNGQPKSGFSNGGQVEPRDTAELSLLSDLYQQVCGCVQAGPDAGVTPPCFWGASRFRAARIQIQFPGTVTRRIGSLLQLVSTDEFRSRFHVDAFVFSASSLEDVFLFLASTRLVTASKVAPLQDRAPARTAPKATTVSLVRHESFRSGRRMTAEEDLLDNDTLTVEESMNDRQKKIIDQANASLSLAIQEKSRMMGARAIHSPRSAYRGRRGNTKKRDKGLSRLFQIQSNRASSGSARGERRINQFGLLLGKRIILNLRSTTSLLLVWFLAISATILSYFFQSPVFSEVPQFINVSHDVTTGSLRLSAPGEKLLVYVSDTTNGSDATMRNTSIAFVEAVNHIAAEDPFFPEAMFIDGGMSALQLLLADLETQTLPNLTVGAILLEGLNSTFNPFSPPPSGPHWPWSPRDELHLQVASMSDVTLIYNTSLLPAQLMLVNFLDAVQLNFVVRGARLAEPTDDAELASALTNTSKGRALDINVQFQAFPAQVDEKIPYSDIVDAQFLYVTLGMGPVFGTLAHHVLAERENGFFLLQELCLLSPFAYWSSLFAADALVLVFFPFFVSLVIQTLFDPCVFGGILTGRYDIALALAALYIFCAAAIMSSVYLFTRIFRGHGERANTALFLTLLLYTLGTVTFNAIFTVVDVLVSTENPVLGGFNFFFYTIFPPYALYNGLVGLATYGKRSMQPLCYFPDNNFVNNVDDGPWPDMSIVLSALAVNCLWTYTLNIFLAYRARGHDERQQHKKYLAQQLKQKADTARRKAGLRAKRHHVSDLESGAPAAHTESEPEQPSQLAGLSRRLPRKPSKSRQRHYSLAPGVQRRHPEDGLGLGAEVDQPIKDVVDEILHLEDESVMENRKEILKLYQRSFELARTTDPTGKNEPTLSVLDLKKTFPLGRGKNGKQKTVPAVNGISLSFAAGETFGLLGPNGAGKTTTLRMLANTLVPSSGIVMHNRNVVYADAKVTSALAPPGAVGDDSDRTYIAGSIQLRTAGNIVRDKYMIGFCPQHDSIPTNLTGREALLFFSGMRGIESSEAEERAEITAAKLGLLNCFDKRVGTWSPGDRRKLSVAIAFLGDPKLVLLDEPTTGLDPYARRKLLDFVLQYQQLHCNPYQRELHDDLRQPAIVFSTMSVRNAELLCSRMGIMQGGFFSCIGAPQELRAKYTSGYVLSVKLRDQGNRDLATARYNYKRLQQRLLDFLQQGPAHYGDHAADLLGAGSSSVDIPNAQESGNNGEEQDIGSVVDGVDFVDKSAAKFSVLSRSASARLTYFVDRSNNSKDGTVSEGSSLNSAGGSPSSNSAVMATDRTGSERTLRAVADERQSRADATVASATAAAKAAARRSNSEVSHDALPPHEAFETELMVGRGGRLKFKLTHISDVDEVEYDDDSVDETDSSLFEQQRSPRGFAAASDATLVASHVAYLDSIQDPAERRQAARRLGKERARAALQRVQEKQTEHTKALFALIDQLEDHREDLQIESYEVLPYGLQQLFLTCAKQQAKLERARRGSLYISTD